MANGTQGLGFAWEGAVRCDGDAAQVNLLVNRASRLVDVDSYLPYEGKVVIHNKAARRVSARIVSWIDKGKLTATVSGEPRPLSWVGNCLVLDGLKPKDEILLEFPVAESMTSYTANRRVWRHERVYTYTFRGSTAVGVEPKATGATSIPIYDRGHMRTGIAPMKKVVRFVPERPILGW